MIDKEKVAKEDNIMDATVSRDTGYKRLDFSTLNFSDKAMTSEAALKNVTPMQWSEEVLNGDKKVIIKKQ